MSTVTLRQLVLMLALSLTACASSLPRQNAPLPPRVDCQQAATSDPPPAPTCGPEQCAGAWVEHVIVLLGGWTQERQLRAVEHQCVDALKARGVVR